ncbi:MAG: hypothetical protein ACI9JZ_002951, partial [Lentimonas sp.]
GGSSISAIATRKNSAKNSINCIYFLVFQHSP